MRQLRRLVALYRIQLTMDFIWVVRDFRNFVTYYLCEIVLGAASVATTLLLAERFGGFGGWSRDQVLFMLGYAATASGVLETIFAFNVRFISRVIGRGQVDHWLVQPLRLPVAILAQGFAPFTGSAQTLPGLVLLVWAVPRAGVAVTPGWLALFAVNMAASTLIWMSYSFVWGSLAFWAPRAAEEVSSSAGRAVAQLQVFPLDGVPGPLVAGLVTSVPAGLIAWYPSRALLGLDPSPMAAFGTPLAALAAVTVAWWIFTRGLSHYARVGSSRYLSFGFRR